MEDTSAVNQPPYSCQEETFKKQSSPKKTLKYTYINAMELQVHLPDLITRQWSDFSIAPSLLSPTGGLFVPEGAYAGEYADRLAAAFLCSLPSIAQDPCLIRSFAPRSRNLIFFFFCSAGLG